MSLLVKTTEVLAEAKVAILTLRDSCAKKDRALTLAKEKLALYRADHSGEYLGGMEYSVLVKTIEEALAL